MEGVCGCVYVLRVSVRVCVRAGMPACVCVHVCVCVCACVCVYVCDRLPRMSRIDTSLIISRVKMKAPIIMQCCIYSIKQRKF